MIRFVRLLVACFPRCVLCVLALQDLQDGQLLLRTAALTVLCVKKSVSVCQTVGPRRFGPDCKTLTLGRSLSLLVVSMLVSILTVAAPHYRIARQVVTSPLESVFSVKREPESPWQRSRLRFHKIPYVREMF